MKQKKKMGKGRKLKISDPTIRKERMEFIISSVFNGKKFYVSSAECMIFDNNKWELDFSHTKKDAYNTHLSEAREIVDWMRKAGNFYDISIEQA